MYSLRRWLYRPKRSDSSLLAQFYFADEELNLVAAELDSFEGRKDPERCTAMVNQLRACQARVLKVISQMMDETVKEQRAPRDFRVKFPDDVIQENLAGQLWFGAECLAAGSSIMNREVESACMRPLARALTKNLDSLRTILREQCLQSVHDYTETIKESLIIFDKLFAEFELSYVSAMVPVKTAHEYDMIQEITVLFSETVQRALKLGLLTADMIDEYDPALMFTIPRLAIVSGVFVFKDGPLNPDNDPWNISEMFKPFHTLLLKIRELLGILTEAELLTLERALCSQDEPSFLITAEEEKKKEAQEEKRKKKEGRKKKNEKVLESEGDDGSVESELTALEIAERLEALALNFEASRNASTSSVDQEEPSLVTQEATTGSHASTPGEGDPTPQESNSTGDGEAQQLTNQQDCEVNSNSSEESQVHGVTNKLYYAAQTHPADNTQVVRSTSELYSETNSSSSEGTRLQQTANQLYSEVNSSSSDVTQLRQTANRLNPGPSSSSSEESQVHHFTTNLYYEANLDSRDMQSVGTLNTFASDSELNTSASRTSIPNPGLSLPREANLDVESTLCMEDLENHRGGDEVTEDTESSDLPAMVKCGSNDSGLHSEVLSNSGSMFTISSSDSNHLMTSPDTPTLPQSFTHIQEFRQDAGSAHVGEHCVADTHDGHEDLPQTGNSDRKPEEADLTQNKHTTPEKDPPRIEGDDCVGNSGSVCADHVSAGECKSLPTGNSVDGSSSTMSTSSVSKDLDENQNSESEAVVKNVSTVSRSSEISLADPPAPCSQSNNVHSSSCDISVSSGRNVGSSVANNRHGESPNKSKDSDSETSPSSAEARHKTDPPPAASNQTAPPSPAPAQNKASVEEAATSNQTMVGDALLAAKPAHPPTGSDQTTLSSSALPHILTNAGDDAGSTPSPPPASVSRDGRSKHQSSVAVGPATASAVAPDNHSTHNSTQHSTVAGTALVSPSTHSTLAVPQSSGAALQASQAHKKDGGCSAKSKGKTKKAPGVKGTRSSAQSRTRALKDEQAADGEGCNSSETSSYTSDCGDQEEIALAIEAVESATRQQVRARFKNSSDMIHRLFVCISGVADQLQTNFAGDLRNILRSVFDMNCSEPIDITDGGKCKDMTPLGAAYIAISNASQHARRNRSATNQSQGPPSWVPDEQAAECTSCQVPFSFVRRRHHCRNCGKIFCNRCSSNFVPLPHFGQDKCVRVCNRCFMFRVTPFTVRSSAQ